MSYSNKSSLGQLLENQKHFWKIEHFDNEIRIECDSLMMTAKSFLHFYKNYALVLAAIFYIQPFIFHELQMKIFVPNGWFYYLYFVYWYMTPPLFVSVYGVTSMFCALCIPVIIQFKLLAYRFQNLEVNTNKNTLKSQIRKLVDYHNFLIRFTKN